MRAQFLKRGTVGNQCSVVHIYDLNSIPSKHLVRPGPDIHSQEPFSINDYRREIRRVLSNSWRHLGLLVVGSNQHNIATALKGWSKAKKIGKTTAKGTIWLVKE